MHHELKKPQMYENPYAVYGEKYVHHVGYRQKIRTFPTRASDARQRTGQFGGCRRRFNRLETTHVSHGLFDAKDRCEQLVLLETPNHANSNW
jgi:hypothetical protein